MVTQAPHPSDHTFVCIAPNDKPPINNFEQWAKLVKCQMLASLQRRSRYTSS